MPHPNAPIAPWPAVRLPMPSMPLWPGLGRLCLCLLALPAAVQAAERTAQPSPAPAGWQRSTVVAMPLAGLDGSDHSMATAAAPDQGLNFHQQRAHAQIRRALTVRMELGSGTAITVRPRGGRVLLQLHSQW